MTRGAASGSSARTPSSRTSASATRAATRRARTRAASASCLALHARAPGDGRRPRRTRRCSTSARGMPPVDGPGDRPLRRGALDLHRARVPDAGRALADAAHGGRPLRARRARRCTRRSTASSSGARTATSSGDYGGLLVLAPRRAVLDAARAPRPGDARDGRGRARARRSRGSARPRSTAAGSRTCTCSCSPTWSATSTASRCRDEADLWRSVCPDPNLLLGLPGGVDARGRARPDIAARRPDGDEPGALARLRRAAAHRPRRAAPTCTTPTAARTSTSSTTSRTSATATRAWSRRARGRWRC